LDKPEPDEPKPMSLLQVAQSVLAALFGVQSNRNRERDFKQGSAKTFIIAGLVGTVLFIAVVATVVKVVLGMATG
jgi:predicted cobalt transporter CbtA